ncbi:hypothetical protein A4X09_0g4813 [Tilletia walkeri]|uniref:Ribosomal eL28/Mak16 domain-containing protein n=1 Tax=Tilletia walkeri TaxID=117179 RepID=A0A8X7N700_9BASI|nr:hypothetical protein A4X09_0g4813 [Tilletia walkeri]
MPGLAVSNELEYLLTRTTSSYIVKQASLPRYFSREPRNLAQIHSFKFSGTTNAKTIGIEPVSGGGVAVVTRKSKASPSALKGAYTATTIKKGGSRRVAGVVSNLTKNGYRRDLTQREFLFLSGPP